MNCVDSTLSLQKLYMMKKIGVSYSNFIFLLLGVLLSAVYYQNSIFWTAASYFKESNYFSAMVAFLSAKEVKTDEFQCLQCDIWLNATNAADVAWNHETFLRKYLFEILKGSLTGYSQKTESISNTGETHTFDEVERFHGKDWPRFGVTMIGLVRLNSLQKMLEYVILENIEGDFMECGVWRGGASIFARAVIVAYQSSKKVYVVDSFAGLPPSRSNKDENFWSNMKLLAVSLENVQANFQRFGVFDNSSVIFVKGFFNDTMPKAHKLIESLSVLRLDGDMYESCFDVLAYMYSHVSIGGYVVIDDWTGFPCKQAALDIRYELGIEEKIYTIDDGSVYWQKSSHKVYNISALYSQLFDA